MTVGRGRRRGSKNLIFKTLPFSNVCIRGFDLSIQNAFE